MARANTKLRRTFVKRTPAWNADLGRWELVANDEAHKRTRVYQVDEFENELPPTSVIEAKGWVPYQHAPEKAKRLLARNAVHLALNGVNPHEDPKGRNREEAARRGLTWETWEDSKSDANAA